MTRLPPPSTRNKPSEHGMAVSAAPELNNASSDYGSDFDTDGEAFISDLLSEPTADDTLNNLVLESIEDDLSATPSSALLLPKDSRWLPLQAEGQEADKLDTYLRQRSMRSPTVEVEYDECSRASWDVASDSQLRDNRTGGRSYSVQPQSDIGVKGTRSPLQRYRTKPKKPLSVTDIVSPAWCELQYWYTLTKFGKKLATPAMRQGTAVHKQLEQQVHRTVQIRVKSKEDAFGLRIWNVIQGLRTLREMGMTRELELWGVVDGQVINGVIDQLSYTCPDAQFEDKLAVLRAQQSARGKDPFRCQVGIDKYFQPVELADSHYLPSETPQTRSKIYITDVKTRGSRYLPQGATLRPTKMQLMLYRMLLDSLASNTVPADTIFARYDLKPLDPFSPAFVDEVAAIEVDCHEEKTLATIEPPGSHSFCIDELRAHNNLSALWSLMVSEAVCSLPVLSDVLQAEFRHSRTGEIIGSEIFAYNALELQKYLNEKMSWWRGEREARGVDIEEVFKCRICDFAEGCSWRIEKIEEATEKHRLRAAARRRSAV